MPKELILFDISIWTRECLAPDHYDAAQTMTDVISLLDIVGSVIIAGTSLKFRQRFRNTFVVALIKQVLI